jgi:glycosyltransferase involved in cell wall biosynthesis
MKPHLLLITKDDASLIHFREPFISDWLEKGYKLSVIAPFTRQDIQSYLEKKNVSCTRLDLKGTQLSPFSDLYHFFQLFFLVQKISPSHSLCYFAKPIIWGSLACFLAKVPQRFVLIEGLGFAFTTDPFASGLKALKKICLKFLMKNLYKISLKTVTLSLFLNSDDQDYFLKENLITKNHSDLLGPIGLNLSWWSDPYKNQKLFSYPVTFIFVGRLLREKGLLVLIESARKLQSYINQSLLKIQIVGAPDKNPGAISLDTVKQWEKEGLIEYLGFSHNIKEHLSQAHVFVLPSYREGYPKSTQEACAMSMPIITTDSVGCRHSIIDQYNGFLVKTHDSDDLAKKIEFFIKNPEKIKTMGTHSRQFALDHLDSKKINEKFISFLTLNSN